MDGMFSSSFFAVAVQRRQHDPPLNDMPDPSGVVPPCTGIPLLPVFFELLPPTFSALRVLSFFRLDVQAGLFAPALGAGPLPQHVF